MDNTLEISLNSIDMYKVPENHIIVQVVARVYKKQSVNEAGSILWKEQKEKVTVAFTCDKDIAPWSNYNALKSEIIKPALSNASSTDVRLEYHSHEVLQSAPVNIQDFADEAMQTYVDRRFYSENNPELEAVKIQNEAMNKIFSYFNL